MATTTTEAAKALLRTVPEVALDRGWIQGQLATGADAGRYGISVERHEILRYTDANRNKEPASCSDITGCCALGFVQLTAVCANGWGSDVVSEAERLLGDTLVELGWADQVFQRYYDNQNEEHETHGYAPLAPFGDWRDEIVEGRDYDEIGEGLLAEWNDYFCESKEQFLELAAKAAA